MELLLPPPAPKLSGSTMSDRCGFKYMGVISKTLDLVAALLFTNYIFSDKLSNLLIPVFSVKWEE